MRPLRKSTPVDRLVEDVLRIQGELELRMLARGVDVSYATGRHWIVKFATADRPHSASLRHFCILLSVLDTSSTFSNFAGSLQTATA